LPALVGNGLTCLLDFVDGQWRNLDLWDGDKQVPFSHQLDPGGRGLDLNASVDNAHLKFAVGLDFRLAPNFLGYKQSTVSINGRLHTNKNTTVARVQSLLSLATLLRWLVPRDGEGEEQRDVDRVDDERGSQEREGSAGGAVEDKDVFQHPGDHEIG